MSEQFTEETEEFTEEFQDEMSDAAGDRELAYPHAEAWVQEWLLPHYRRNPQQRRWDPQWWRYEEISTVLEALWETWEHMRWEGATGMIVFFRDYFWPTMDVITSPDGPLWSFNAERRQNVPNAWPVEPAPEGYFTAKP